MNEQDTSKIPPIDTAASFNAAEAALNSADQVKAKLADAGVPGYQADFDPDEAELAGAFEEDALSEADALASTHDAATAT
ncbi:MAG: hypothetical protein JO002_07375 [Burkholderiaceae bacterium]|nr:hypothetical protein [Burkholderiaceae bacterium]